MLKLPKRELPAVTFRRELPDYLSGGKEPCFIEIEARAGGLVNPAYVSRMEQVYKRARVMDRKAEAISDDPEGFVETNWKNSIEAARARLAVLYDACVIGWESNILDGDDVIECTRDTFLALSEVKGVPEITRAVTDFETACLKAGSVQAQSDEDEVKN